MTQLVAWIGICLVVAILLRRRPILLVVGSVVLWVAIPGVASGIVTGQDRGSSLGFHPSTWLIAITFLVVLLQDVRSVLEEIGRRILTYLALSLFLAVALLATKSSASGGGLVLFFSQMLAPILMFIVINVALHARFEDIFVLRNWVVGLAVVQSAIAMVEWTTGSVLLYRAQYETQYWFDEVKFPRWMGTLDHPLTLSLFLCVALPLLAGIRSIWIQLPALLIMAAGVLTTQSRTGLAIAGLGVLYVVVTSRINFAAKVLSLLVVGFATIYAASSALSEGVADRLAQDSGSTLARGEAWDFVLGNLSRYMFTGGGIGSSYDAAELGGLTTSLESSILIYAVDIGVAFAVLYFGTQLAIVIRGAGFSLVPGLTLSALLAVIVPQTFNALGAQTFAGVLIWLVLGMASAMSTERSRRILSRPTWINQRESELRQWRDSLPPRT